MSDYWPEDPPLPLFQPTSREAHHAAVASGLASEHCQIILEALTAGPAGKTELGRRTGLTDQQVIRRMHELRREGLVAPTGHRVLSASGRSENEWRLA